MLKLFLVNLTFIFGFQVYFPPFSLVPLFFVIFLGWVFSEFPVNSAVLCQFLRNMNKLNCYLRLPAWPNRTCKINKPNTASFIYRLHRGMARVSVNIVRIFFVARRPSAVKQEPKWAVITVSFRRSSNTAIHDYHWPGEGSVPRTRTGALEQEAKRPGNAARTHATTHLWRTAAQTVRCPIHSSVVDENRSPTEEAKWPVNAGHTQVHTSEGRLPEQLGGRCIL